MKHEREEFRLTLLLTKLSKRVSHHCTQLLALSYATATRTHMWDVSVRKRKKKKKRGIRIVQQTKLQIHIQFVSTRTWWLLPNGLL
jgi:hypothetical protein